MQNIIKYKIVAFLFVVSMLFSFKGIGQESTASAQVSYITLESPQLHTSKKIAIYLPVGYTTSNKKYPVLYMQDAQNLFDKKTSFAGEWNVDETLDSLDAQTIVVAISHGNEKRIDELTPYQNEKYGGGKAQQYLDFIIQTLKPHIDQNYRTKPDAAHTTIAGSSLGGLLAYYATITRPDVFKKAIVFSPSFWFSKDIYTLTEKTPKITSKIYFLCGDKESDDMVADMQKMVHLVQTKIKNKSQIFETVIKGGEHNEKLWREAFAKAYLWSSK